MMNLVSLPPWCLKAGTVQVQYKFESLTFTLWLVHTSSYKFQSSLRVSSFVQGLLHHYQSATPVIHDPEILKLHFGQQLIREPEWGLRPFPAENHSLGLGRANCHSRHFILTRASPDDAKVDALCHLALPKSSVWNILKRIGHKINSNVCIQFLFFKVIKEVCCATIPLYKMQCLKKSLKAPSSHEIHAHDYKPLTTATYILGPVWKQDAAAVCPCAVKIKVWLKSQCKPQFRRALLYTSFHITTMCENANFHCFSLLLHYFH